MATSGSFFITSASTACTVLFCRCSTCPYFSSRTSPTKTCARKLFNSSGKEAVIPIVRFLVSRLCEDVKTFPDLDARRSFKLGITLRPTPVSPRSSSRLRRRALDRRVPADGEVSRLQPSLGRQEEKH